LPIKGPAHASGSLSVAWSQRPASARLLIAWVRKALGARLPLLLPLRRHHPCQLLQLHSLRLPPFDDRLLDIRCQQASRNSRLTKLRSIFSASAISAIP
jgi:hypothetical protein